MDRRKYFAGILIAAVFCGGIWLLRCGHPAREQVKGLEEQISTQYTYANFILRDKVEELVEWNFSEPLTVEKEGYFRELFDDFQDIHALFFTGSTVHSEWRDRVMEAELYMMDYVLNSSLSKEDADDLYQILQATRFISRDFSDFITYSDFYEAMHSEEHEMVERVKFRLGTEY